jgi:hypothetical protein
MIHKLNDELLAVVRELARPTTPRELESRGVRHIRSIGLGAVSLLIEKAVNRTLMKRTIGGLAASELGELRAEAEEEFAHQLAELQARSHSRRLVEKQRATVRADLAALRESVAETPAAPSPEVVAVQAAGRQRELRLRIQDLLAPLERAAPENAPVTRDIADELAQLFEEYEQRSLDESRRELEACLELEQRRIAKLVATLEKTEAVLARIARMKDVEHGLASIYRTVQGLSVDEGDYQRKLGLMRAIFDSNVRLHETALHR